MKKLSIEELSNKLSISSATVKNWLRLGKITSQFMENNQPFFSDDYVKNLLKKINNENNQLLKSRRNKNHINGKFLYKDYVSDSSKNIETIENLLNNIQKITLPSDENIIKYILANCSIQLLMQKKNIPTQINSNFLQNYLENQIDLGIYKPLIDFFITSKQDAILFLKKYPQIFDYKFIYEKNEDILGLLYISYSNMGQRKQRGVYYTPTKVVKTSIANLVKQNEIMPDDKILDCCCGTGNFLLHLPENIKIEQIYGNDIDPLSSHIAKINLALKYNIKDLETINSHFSTFDFLENFNQKDFKYIIGNPPWGCCFTNEQKQNLIKNYTTASVKNIESFDLFIEKSLSILKKDGVLSFVLPESVLNVKSHTEIRKIIQKGNSIQYLQYLGNIFNMVHCPSIILQIKHTKRPLQTIGMIVNTGKNQFEINSKRKVDIRNFNFKMNDTEYKILQKIKNPHNKKFLKNNADFALGIVTGNNKEYLSAKKNQKNEVIIKGTDVEQYKIKESRTFIEYNRKNFQQSAPLETYKQPEKLVYKFISSKLVFACDNQQRLTLNSCNILIPKIKNMNIKYILAILNSSIAQFVYKKEFNSVKVLRSHLEQIPIPICEKNLQNEIVNLIDEIVNCDRQEKYLELYENIDEKIRLLYGITTDEYSTIRNSIK